MKKIMILCAFMVAFAASSFAQADTQPAPMSEKTEKTKGRGSKDRKQAVMSMKKQLNLTSEQEMRMKDIADNNKGKLKAIKSDNTLDKTQKREKMLEVQKSFDSDMKSVLNAEQYTKFTELKKQRRANHKGKRGGKGPQ